MKKKVYTAFICLCCAVVSLFAQERVVELTNPSDEYVEITPNSMRMRKIILDELERKRQGR